jgi:hypothetical protein
MTVIDLAAVPDTDRLRRTLAATRRACRRFLSEGKLELAQICKDLQREIRLELRTRETNNG